MDEPDPGLFVRLDARRVPRKGPLYIDIKKNAIWIVQIADGPDSIIPATTMLAKKNEFLVAEI